jgi:hypothetical protein
MCFDSLQDWIGAAVACDNRTAMVAAAIRTAPPVAMPATLERKRRRDGASTGWT